LATSASSSAVLVFSLALSVSCSVTTNELVGYWSFDSGDAMDNSGNGKNGKLYGGVGFVEGIKGKAASFDGVDDYIEIDISSKNFQNSYTISCWVYVYNFNNNYPHLIGGENNCIAFHGTGPAYGASGQNKIAFYQDDYTKNPNNRILKSISTNKISLNTFHHILVVKNQYEGSIYVDGIKTNSNSIFNSSIIDGNFIRIGSGYTTSKDMNIQGLIDEVRIYNRALEENEIQALYKESK